MICDQFVWSDLEEYWGSCGWEKIGVETDVFAEENHSVLIGNENIDTKINCSTNH